MSSNIASQSIKFSSQLSSSAKSRTNSATSFTSLADLLRFLRDQMELVEPAKLTSPACRDPDDDMILATGLAAHANCIVTSDSDLLDLKQYEGIPIIKPAEFWRFEASFGN